MRLSVYLPLITIALSSACTRGIRRNAFAATAGSLIQADRDFAVETHARGIDGRMSFYAPDAVRVRYRGNMIKGLAAVRAFDLPGIMDTTGTLNWEPSDAYVFRDGAIGSTTGKYWIASHQTGELGKELGHERYVTMWRWDGRRWLVIMDTGYPEPVTPTH
jgi:ketosteroid isomerase-like protein